MRTNRVASVIALAGAGLVSFAVVHFLTHEIYTVTTWHILSNLVVAGGAGIGLLYVAYWLSDQSFSTARNERILAWTGLGAGVLLAIFLLVQPMAQETVTDEELVHIVQVSLGVGGLLGAAIGSFEARALSRAEEVTRVESRLAALEDERERWAELNTVFGHYVNNSVTVIDFCLADLRERVTDETSREHVEKIADRVETIATVAEHVDRLGPAPEFDSVSPATELASVSEQASHLAEIDADLSMEIPEDGPTVVGGASVAQDLALLLEALAEIAAPDGRIECAFEAQNGAVLARFTARPATLPAGIEDALFEPVTRQSGLKLYFAERSIDSYGALSLARSDDDAVAFEIRFESASDH
ncbi:hypothetical protein Hrd1104_01205 [Halorhabdus sp. CBA1104]|uniref:hypothetical protein n=1 Tax=Halorhabdus sp. CBA1104 TaxID=1380432 RepID=UPI0012B32CF7|nr:hypothetical protein [Halorhabdus sp. CBA1104]QGN06042.1 hypothetical protein Hrd1104_01205 [Halorhabdus sp. CBA1104]